MKIYIDPLCLGIEPLHAFSFTKTEYSRETINIKVTRKPRVYCITLGDFIKKQDPYSEKKYYKVEFLKKCSTMENAIKYMEKQNLKYEKIKSDLPDFDILLYDNGCYDRALFAIMEKQIYAIHVPI